MYQVLIDGQVLYDPTLKDYKIFNPRVQLEVNKVGRFDFSIYPSHPRYNSILKLRSHIEVYQNGELIFRGRPLDDDVDFNKCKTVLCESDLAYLNDSIMRPYDFQGGVRDFLAVIINNHNSQVDASKQFTLGKVHAFGDFVRSNSEYTNTWEELSTKTFGSSMGGYLQLRRENDINYIDYLSDSLYISGQTIELSKNLLDYEKTVKASDIVTVLIPLGAKLKDEEGNELDERLTIESVNAGSKFIEHTKGISKYGRIVGYKIWDDINSPSLLKTRATNDLNFLVNLGISIKIKAIDLNILDKSIPKIRFFQYVKIISKPHEIDDSMLIKKQTIHLDDPSQNTIEVGVEVSSFTDKQLEANNTIKIIKSDYVTNEKMTNVITPITVQVSQIIQESDRIELSVSEIRTDLENIELTPGPKGPKGDKGDKGETGSRGATGAIGPRGENGTSVTGIVEFYGLSTSDTVKPTSWTEIVSEATPLPKMTSTNKYLWNYEKINFSNGPSQDTVPVIVGVYGDKGAPGSAGTDGRSIVSIKEKYQVNNLASGVTKETGTWIDVPTATSDTNKYLWNYEIITWNKAPITTYVDPIIIGVHGNKGDKGAAGPQGIQGPPGANGLPTYTWIAYATSAAGANISLSPTGKDYVGYASGQTSKTPSITTPSLYTWQLVKGATGGQGPQGIQGGTGPKGDPVYTWIKYADTPTSGMTDDPTDKKYIGMAHNKPTATESTTYSDYTWSLMPQNITIGGRNLFSVNKYVSLRNSEGTSNGNSYSVGSSGALVVSGVDGSGGYDTMRMVDLKADTEYIFTFNIPINDRFSLYDTDGVVVDVTENWSNNNTQLTFKMGNVDGYFGGKFYPIEQNYPVDIYLMAEKGNTATDWTPAPEDIQSEIDDNKNKIEDVQQLTTAHTAQISVNSQDIQQEIIERVSMGDDILTEMRSAIKLEVDNMDISFSDLREKIENNEVTLADVTAYFNFSANGLEIGKSDSPFKINIDNEEISFLQNGTKVAYITGSTLYIQQSTILNSITMANHIIEKSPFTSGRTLFRRI